MQLQYGSDERSSWHRDYADSAYIYIGGLPYALTEGDVICIFSQYGEPLDIHLMRDKETGKSRGFCFLKYEDQRSTVLAVDNLNGTKILGRTISVDHVSRFRIPKTEDGDGNTDVTNNTGNRIDAGLNRDSNVGDGTADIGDRRGFNVAPAHILERISRTKERTNEQIIDSAESADDKDKLAAEDPMYNYIHEKKKDEGRPSEHELVQAKEREPVHVQEPAREPTQLLERQPPKKKKMYGSKLFKKGVQ